MDQSASMHDQPSYSCKTSHCPTEEVAFPLSQAVVLIDSRQPPIVQFLQKRYFSGSPDMAQLALFRVSAVASYYGLM